MNTDTTSTRTDWQLQESLDFRNSVKWNKRFNNGYIYQFQNSHRFTVSLSCCRRNWNAFFGQTHLTLWNFSNFQSIAKVQNGTTRHLITPLFENNWIYQLGWTDVSQQKLWIIFLIQRKERTEQELYQSLMVTPFSVPSKVLPQATLLTKLFWLSPWQDCFRRCWEVQSSSEETHSKLYLR